MGLGLPAFDIEGRAQILEVEGLRIYNLYVPNGGRDHERVPYKLAFYEALLADLNPRLERGEALVVVGDFNTAHRPIDLSNPKANERTTGFLPEERAWVDRFLATGLRDVFRDAHPDESGHHTWWSNRPGIRQRNIGWRIDYFLVSPAVLPRVRSATIRPEVMGSDHCPIALELD
jgi:exodeoxyribonuclease-3